MIDTNELRRVLRVRAILVSARDKTTPPIRIGDLLDETDRLRAENVALKNAHGLAYRTACRLLDALHPGLLKLPTTEGVIHQIDNATMYIKAANASIPFSTLEGAKEIAALKAALQKIVTEYRHADVAGIDVMAQIAMDAMEQTSIGGMDPAKRKATTD